jgi:cytochrome c biogenesis protein CcdA
MLPAYFASSFQNRRLLVAMTFLFAAGVGTIILPLAMGAAVLQQIFSDQHRPIYLGAGLVLLGLAVYTLLGGRIHLPTPGRRAGAKAGPLSVYSLGIFSGVASSCCAPVLAGVIALAGVASSFGLALGLGTAYVLGMVAPLFVISLLWDWFDWGSSRLFRPRAFTWRFGPLQRTLGATELASGILLAVMGVATLWAGLTSSSMPRLTGWQATLSVELQHYGNLVTRSLAWIPGWLAGISLLCVVGILAWHAARQLGWLGDFNGESTEAPEAKEEVLEHSSARSG